MDDSPLLHGSSETTANVVETAEPSGYFAQLDQEIAAQDCAILPCLTSSPRSEPMLNRLIATLKTKLGPTKGPPQANDLTAVTCRLCEENICPHELDRHTELCSTLQEYMGKKFLYSDLLDQIVIELQKIQSQDESAIALADILIKARQINIQDGKSAAIKLAKLHYLLTKFDPETDACKAFVKRIKFIVNVLPV